jgi:hemoglobin/transferrin/lactoferrin receptor protein
VSLVLLPTGEGAIRVWNAALDDLATRGATAVIVVPMPDGQADRLLAIIDDLPQAGVRITQPPHVVHELAVARWIERAATDSTVRSGLPPDATPYRLPALNVTGTRTVRTTDGTPTGIAVLSRDRITEHWASTAADLFREVPGLDVEGVGANQRRPAIRGLLGQRILVLADGIRLNNTRRRQGSGETPALIDLINVDRIEVVRGPASVLYGSDAVGGVVNLIELTPDAKPGGGAAGYVRMRYRTADRQVSPAFGVTTRAGRLAFRISGTYRHAIPYDAPAGTFGPITLDSTTRVQDTGVDDVTGSVAVAYRLGPGHTLLAKHERYRARNAGFGLVDPSLIGEGLSTIRITFPDQRFQRTLVRYRGANLGWGIADGLSFTAYRQRNRRQFDSNTHSPLGPPGAFVSVASRNFTDIETYGFRLEARRTLGDDHILTYGADLFRDRAEGTDSTRTTVNLGGDTTVRERTVPRLPTATFRSVGVFVQSELHLFNRAVVVVGVRYQDVGTATAPTAGVTQPLVRAADRTVVGAVTALLPVTSHLHIRAGVGRAFRSPNLVERFFAGPSPEGRGIWVTNLDLRPETSLNLDAGARLRTRGLAIEASVFRNTIRDAIRVEATGNMVNGVPEFQHRNVERLRYSGFELAAEVASESHVSFSGEVSRVTTLNVLDPEQPVGDGYANRVRVQARYADSAGRFHVDYVIRHQGRRDHADLGRSPLLPYIPAFTVHALRGGIVLHQGVHLAIAVENLTNVLYAEATNVGFFRPEPRRHITLDVAWEF